MHLLYLTFGDNINTHIQAHFSITTFLAQKEGITSINVITDYPDFYASLKDYVKVIPIDDDQLKQWKGDYDFFWRVKIKAIEMMCDQYKNEPVLYVDSDTFLFTDIQTLLQPVRNGKALMHENEGSLEHEKSKTAKKMWKQIKHKNFGGVIIQPHHTMWNAGVVLTPNTTNNKDCSLALHICDEMCRQNVTRRLIEQFALSVALQETYGLHEANDSIAHYWSNKESWNEAIKNFFLAASFKALSFQQTIEEIKKFDFANLPVKVKIKSTNTRLKKTIDNIFPSTNHVHVSAQK